ncbi:hypothetical protein QR680_017469 [Steinernema hermaphroditum]|uniref:Pseudouridine synthase II N-terminal domain-containing protein n=1 Tax=Steinernema hermaphroditum TaxID=289476 RepID=A0AA39LP74_9BILA|nr:hypothetical protein QR680_017469 [Steinernema hermaphroditum]
MRVSLGPSEVGKLLNGVVTVCKQRDVSVSSLRSALIAKICEEGNSLGDLFVPTVEIPVVEPHTKSQALVVVGMKKQLDYSLHPLVSGFPFREEDIRFEEMHYQDPMTSGLCVIGVNDGCDDLPELRKKNWINCFDIDAQLGRQTLNNDIRGKVVATQPYEHVTRYRLEKVFTRLKSQFKRASFELMHCDLQSEEAFEAARKAIKYFKPPHIGLQIQCTGVNVKFLTSFVQELGFMVDSTASVRRLHCSRVGPFLAENAIVPRDISLSSIIKNVVNNRRIIAGYKTGPSLSSAEYTPSEEEHTEEEESVKDVDCVKMSWARGYTSV